VVIELRADSKLSTDKAAVGGLLIPSDDSTNTQKPSTQRDDIEEQFGKLETEFLQSIHQKPDSLHQSRNDSIKLIYDVKSPSDWAKLIEGHDDHVISLNS
jgi:hypothetical protein